MGMRIQLGYYGKIYTFSINGENIPRESFAHRIDFRFLEVVQLLPLPRVYSPNAGNVVQPLYYVAFTKRSLID